MVIKMPNTVETVGKLTVVLGESYSQTVKITYFEFRRLRLLQQRFQIEAGFLRDEASAFWGHLPERGRCVQRRSKVRCRAHKSVIERGGVRAVVVVTEWRNR